jgi:hypothetical protein
MIFSGPVMPVDSPALRDETDMLQGGVIDEAQSIPMETRLCSMNPQEERAQWFTAGSRSG